MVLDFSEKGECHVIQDEHVSNMIDGWPEDIDEKDVSITPASNSLFEVGDSGLLSDSKREMFHKTVAKGIFVAGRSRPDITPTISVLSGRVRCPNQNDWGKCRRLIQYLNGTRNLHLILRWDGLSVAR